MKKLLAIILAGLMVFSAVGVLAEETTTTEDTTTGGYFGSSGVTSLTETFDWTSGYTTSYGTASYKSTGKWGLRNDYSATGWRCVNPNSVEFRDGSDTEKYFSMSLSWENALMSYTRSGVTTEHPINNPRLVTNNVTIDEITTTPYRVYNAASSELKISFDIKNDDLIFPKYVKYQAAHGTGGELGYRLLKMGTDGYMYFHNEDTEKYKYEIGTWYSVEITLNFATGESLYKINDDVVYEGTVAYTESDLVTFAFRIQGSAADLEEGQVSTMNFDNLELSLSEVVAPNGHLSKDDGIAYKYEDDYSTIATRPTGDKKYTSTVDGVDVNLRYGGTYTVIDYYGSSESPVDSESGQYLSIHQGKEVVEEYGPAYQYVFNFTGFGQDEKLHISFDAKNCDSNADKHIFLSRQVQPMQAVTGRSRTLINMQKDGLMSFGNFDDSLTDDYTVAYNINQWYHFDIIFDYTDVTIDDTGAITAALGDVYYYVDGVLVAKIEDVDLYALEVNDQSHDFMGRFGFAIYNNPEYKEIQDEYTKLKAENPDLLITDTDLQYASDMELNVDNLKVEICANVEEPEFTIATPAYSLTNFAVTDFTIGQAGTITASATLANTDPTKKVTFAIATYNANNELTGIKIGATYVLSGNISLTADVAATDTCVKVFVLDDAASITPIQAATVIGTPAA